MCCFMNKRWFLSSGWYILLLVLVVCFNYFKVYNQGGHYKLDSFIYKQIYFQIGGLPFSEAKEKVFADKKIVFSDEATRQIIENPPVYQKLYSMFPKRPFYPMVAYAVNLVTRNETFAFAAIPFVGYLGFVLSFYFLCLQIFGKKWAFGASVMAAFYNPLILSAATFMPDTVAAFFWMFLVISAFKYVKEGANKWLILFAIFEVAGLTVREQSLLVLPFSLTIALILPNVSRGKTFFKRSKKIFLLAVFFVLVYHLVLLVFKQKTFFDTILYLQNGYGLHEQAFSLSSTIRFYLSSLLEAHIVFGQVLLTYPLRLIILILAIFGIKRAVSDKKNIVINTVMFASGFASYLAIFAYPVPNPRYFFPLAASVVYFAVNLLSKLSKSNKLIKLIRLRYLVLAVLIAVIGTIVVARSKTDFGELLKGVDIETLESGGVRYSLKGGILSPKGNDDVLRLAAFYQWNKEDPLFDSPGFDVGAFRKSVDLLVNEQNILLSFIKKSDHVYPVDFLGAMADAAQANQNFMKNPSDWSAQVLWDKQFRAAEFYQQEALNLIRSVEAAKFYSPILMNITTNKNVALSDLKMIVKNGEELKREIEKRKACFGGKGKCLRPAFLFAQVNELKKFSDPDLNLLEKSLVYWDGRGVEAVGGPYGVNTPCYGWGKNFTYPTRYFYLNRLEEGGREGIAPILEVRLADDMYFEKVTDNTNLYYKKKLLQRNIPYAVFSATATYRCPDLSYLPEASTVGQFLAKSGPILGEFAGQNGLEEAKIAESNFFSRKYPSYEELKQLGKIYAYVYRIAQSKDSSLELASLKEELLRRKLEIEREFLDMPGFFNYVTWFINVTRHYEEIELKAGSAQAQNVLYPEFSQNIVYPLRSYYSVMYMPFSKSVWRRPETLQYAEKILLKGLVGFDNVLLNYKTALSRYSADEIRSWLITRNDLLDDCDLRNICN